VKVSTLIVLLVVVGGIAFVGLAYTGVISVGIFNRKTLTEAEENVSRKVAGFTEAKTPGDAMDKFMDAIQKRKYSYAAHYVTGRYSDLLRKANKEAAELGGVIDGILSYAKEKGIASDKTKQALFLLDPFPKTFKIGSAPAAKGDKTVGLYVWEGLGLKDYNSNLGNDANTLDGKMFQNVLCPRAVFAGPIEIVKEGEEYKLNIPVPAGMDASVDYFVASYKAYVTGMSNFRLWMTNDRFSSATDLEKDLFEALRKAKS
jgi:hypothetical protein